MNDLAKTLAYVGVAAALAGAAAWSRMPVRTNPAAFSGEGKKFYDTLDDPKLATGLEVVEYNGAEAKVDRFKVSQDGATWKIPTHFNYPADAADRLAKTAGAVIGLVQEQLVTSSKDQFAKLGVVSPEEAGGSEAGRGKLIRLFKSGSDQPAAEYIIGNEVPSRPGYRYVRRPDKNQVYAVRVNADISTKFADWIETNLLKIDAAKIAKVTFNHNHFEYNAESEADPFKGFISGDVFAADRTPKDQKWVLDGPALLPDQEVDAAKFSSLTSALGDVKIVGVRTKPQNIISEIKNPTGPDLFAPVPAFSKEWLKSLARLVPLQLGMADSAQQAPLGPETSGFYIAFSGKEVERNGKVVQALSPTGLVPSAAAVQVATEDGFVYNLFFGQSLFAKGDELTAGSPAAKAAEPKKDEAKKEGDEPKKDEAKADEDPAKPGEPKSEESRYLFVTVTFDPKLIPPPEPGPDVSPGMEEVAFEDPFQEDQFKEHPIRERRKAAQEAEDARMKRAQEDHTKKIEENRKKAEQLTNRFANWYYVTRGDAYKQIALTRNDVVKAKGAQPPEGAAGAPGPGGGIPGLPNLPFPTGP